MRTAIRSTWAACSSVNPTAKQHIFGLVRRGHSQTLTPTTYSQAGLTRDRLLVTPRHRRLKAACLRYPNPWIIGSRSGLCPTTVGYAGVPDNGILRYQSQDNCRSSPVRISMLPFRNVTYLLRSPFIGAAATGSPIPGWAFSGTDICPGLTSQQVSANSGTINANRQEFLSSKVHLWITVALVW